MLADKYSWSNEKVQVARDVLLAISQRVTPRVELDVVKRDPDDNKILECSLASCSDYIVTGDKDLLDLKRYGGAVIVKPVEFLSLLQEHIAKR